MEDKNNKRMSNEVLAEEIKKYIDIKSNDLKEELLKEIDVKLDNNQYRVWKGLHISLSEQIEKSSHGVVTLVNRVLNKVDKPRR